MATYTTEFFQKCGKKAKHKPLTRQRSLEMLAARKDRGSDGRKLSERGETRKPQ